MAWKERTGQQTLGDGLVQQHKSLEALDEINRLVDWNRLEVLLKDIYSSNAGRKSYHPLMMLKALLIGVWYRLSDPGLESGLARDLLFKRFCGLTLSCDVPDHSTICRYREKLVSARLWDKILNEINHQLAKKQLFLKEGASSIVDATLVRAATNPPPYQKNVEKQNDVVGKLAKDTDARWTSKTKEKGITESVYGYKAHTNADEDGFIQKIIITPANVYEGHMLEKSLTGQEISVSADAAYDSRENHKVIKKHNLEDRIIKKAQRNRPLSKEEKLRNKQLSCTRSIVERVFGTLKRGYEGVRRSRFIGIAKNQLQISLIAVAYNLKRGVSLLKEVMMCSQEESVQMI